jgi:hypothetical protein
MATRFYLSSTATAPGLPTPGFAAWGRTTEGTRQEMKVDKDGSALTNKTVWAGGAAATNESALARQYISPPMAAGVAFATSDTIKGVVRVFESATNDNINRQPICLKVYAADGTTLQSTLFALAHAGPATTEWVVSTLTNRRFADGDTLAANYTTVAGDRLVLEIGGQVDATGGTSVTGTMNFGSSAASDLAEDETSTTANNPFFEISRTISFLAPQDADDSWWSLSLQQAGAVAIATAAALTLQVSQAVATQPQDDFAPVLIPIAESSGPNMGPVLWPTVAAIPAPYRWAIDEIVPQPTPLADDDPGYRAPVLWGSSPPSQPLSIPDELAGIRADDDPGYRPATSANPGTPSVFWGADDLPVTPVTPIDDDARWFPGPMPADPAGSAVWLVDASESLPGIADDDTGAPWLLFEPTAWTAIVAPWTFDQGESFFAPINEDYWQPTPQIPTSRPGQPFGGDDQIVPQPASALANEAYWQNPVRPTVWAPPAVLLQPWWGDVQDLVAPALPNEEHWSSGVAPAIRTPPARLLQPWQWDSQEIPAAPVPLVEESEWTARSQFVAAPTLLQWSDGLEAAFAPATPAVPDEAAGPAWLLVPVSTWTTILAPWTFDQGEAGNNLVIPVITKLTDRSVPTYALTEWGRPDYRLRPADRERYSLTDRSRP